MSDYVTLMGAEDVARAGRAMDAAAERMQGAAATFEAAVDRLVRALDEHTVRIEQALAKDKSE